MAVFGVDIGTSSCKASCFDGNTCHTVAVTDSYNSFWGNEKLLISAAYLDGENDDVLLVGQEAYNEHLLHPQWYSQEFKRKFAQKGPVLFTRDSQITVDDIYVAMLSRFNEIFIKTGIPVDKLVLTHPASYSAGLVNRLVASARGAGFDDIETLDEPSAAAECYARVHNNVTVGENVLVYDFGGGTFDTALIRLDENGFRHLTGSLGITDCGGADIDYLILADIKKRILSDPALDGEKALNVPGMLSILNEKAVSIKHKLSQQKAVSETIMVGYTPFVYKLTRQELEQMAAPLIARTLELCRQIVDNANLKPKHIQRILLVGGSSRMPMITALLSQCFPAAHVSENEDIEYLVCGGAAMSGCGSEAEMLELKANRGDVRAMTQLAIHCITGDNETGARDIDRGMSLLKAAVQKNGYRACEILGMIMYNGWYGQTTDREAAAGLFLRAAENSDEVDPGTLDLLGDYYREKKDMKKAVRWYSQAASAGDRDSQFSLGQLYLADDKYEEALPLMTAAADQGHSAAQYILGIIYEHGLGDTQADPERSFAYYLSSAQNGDADAQYKVGMRYYQGEEPVDEDNDEAFKWFTQSAGQENADALSSLGECYEKGYGTVININEAYKCYTKAADHDNVFAMGKLAAWYYYGEEPVVEVDYGQAFAYASSAAGEDSGTAAYILALCYDNGNGVRQSRSKALEYYQRAADADIMAAKNDLAFIYCNGTHNVTKDYEKAFRLAHEAAENGYVTSMALVGICFDDGLGRPQNKKKALKWYKKAAEGGHVSSMRYIGIIYYEGAENVDIDKAEAEKWFRKAASNGDEESIEILRTRFAPEPVLAAPKIQFRRNSRFVGSARVYYVRIDLQDSSVRPIKSGTSFDYTLSPGSHRVEVAYGPAYGLGAIDWSSSNCILDKEMDFDPGDILLLDVTTDQMDARWIQVRGQQQ